jgi:hypothetical protein
VKRQQPFAGCVFDVCGKTGDFQYEAPLSRAAERANRFSGQTAWKDEINAL